MIITRTPFRVSLFGGGTDYPTWYREHGGAILGAAIDKYCYLQCRHLPPFFEHRYRIVYSAIELCQRIEEIRHPSVRAVLSRLGVECGLEIHHAGDIPARSGMASSSAFTVGLLHAVHGLAGRIRSRHELALEGIEIEQNILCENVGSQDQVLVAYGGLNRVDFLPDGDIRVHPVTVLPEHVRSLEDRLMLFFTGVRRTASHVAGSYTDGLAAKAPILTRMVGFVDEALRLLASGDVDDIGHLMHENWRLKRELGRRVSNAFVDELYAAARETGALGGKLTGAGGGGFLLLFVPPERQAAVRERLHHLIHVPFRFETNGSQVIFYAPQEEYARLSAEPRGEYHLPFRELAPDGTAPDGGAP